MQVNNELKDILLERNDNGGANTKKILLIIAAAVILFLAVIVIMKFINSDPEAQSNANVEADSRLVLPPAPSEQNLAINQPTPAAVVPKTEPVDNMAETKSDEQLFEQVPIIPESKSQDDFEDMVKKLKDKSNTSANTIQATQKKPEPKQVAKAVEEPVLKPEPKKEEVKKEPAKPVNVEPKAEPAKKPEPVVAPKPELKKEPAKPVTNGAKGAYVQVAAISKSSPDVALVNKITAKGYSYTTLKAGNMTKVIVGPFSNDKIQGALSDIRKDIASGAFIYRVK